jgi:putative ABC transport system permease protein
VLLPMVAVSTRFHEVMGFVVLTIFFVMVAAGVANPVLMAVLERTREFGIMLALGTSQSLLFRLVLAEAALLGAAGLLLGNAVGLGATAAFGRIGIDLGAFAAGLRTMPGLEDVIYPAVRAERSLFISAMVFVIALLMALYPAFRAATLEPVAAIRGIGESGKARVRGRGEPAPARRSRWPVFVLIAARNLLRNRKRSAITAFAAAFAIVAYVFLYGFFDGFAEQIVGNSTGYLTGTCRSSARAASGPGARTGLRGRRRRPEGGADPARRRCGSAARAGAGAGEQRDEVGGGDALRRRP